MKEVFKLVEKVMKNVKWPEEDKVNFARDITRFMFIGQFIFLIPYVHFYRILKYGALLMQNPRSQSAQRLSSPYIFRASPPIWMLSMQLPRSTTSRLLKTVHSASVVHTTEQNQVLSVT